MKASDIAKLAAAIAAGSITQQTALAQLESDGERSLLNQLLAAGAGAATGTAVASIMDATGVSDLIDDVADSIFDF
jgi:hypothetical protein